MNPGKAIAQAIHAGHQFTFSHGKTKEYKEWAGELGYGTTITLAASREEINRVSEPAFFKCGWVEDPTYPVVVPRDLLCLIDHKKLSADPEIIDDDRRVVLCRPEQTCAYIFGDKEELEKYVGHLPLWD